MAHQWSFPLDSDTASNLVATVINILQRCSNHVHVVVSVNAASNAQTQQVETTKAVLTSHGITIGEDVTNLATTNTSLEVKFPLDADKECRTRRAC